MRLNREFMDNNNPALCAGLFLFCKRGFTLVEIMIVVAIIGLLISIALPGFMQYRDDTQAGLCQNYLRLIDHAKSVWASKRSWVTGDAVVDGEVNAYIKGGAPSCPRGGTYTYNVVGTDPTCSEGGDHTI